MRYFRTYRKRVKAPKIVIGVDALPINPVSSKRPRNVVDALFTHFAKWKPEALQNASSLQEMRETRSGDR